MSGHRAVPDTPWGVVDDAVEPVGGERELEFDIFYGMEDAEKGQFNAEAGWVLARESGEDSLGGGHATLFFRLFFGT